MNKFEQEDHMRLWVMFACAALAGHNAPPDPNAAANFADQTANLMMSKYIKRYVVPQDAPTNPEPVEERATAPAAPQRHFGDPIPPTHDKHGNAYAPKHSSVSEGALAGNVEQNPESNG